MSPGLSVTPVRVTLAIGREPLRISRFRVPTLSVSTVGFGSVMLPMRFVPSDLAGIRRVASEMERPENWFKAIDS